MNQLDLHFLGTFQVIVTGQPVRLKRNKSRALLAYLAVEAERSHERATLAGLLWPEMPERTALRNFSNNLSQLRRCGGYLTHPTDFWQFVFSH